MILGPAIITDQQQRELRDGRMLNLYRGMVFHDAAEKAKPGDIFWIKEPYWIAQSRAFGPQNIHEIVPGPIVGKTEWPAHVKPHVHQLRLTRGPARSLNRTESRACLEIISPITRPNPGWLCRVHMQNVDKRGAAA